MISPLIMMKFKGNVSKILDTNSYNNIALSFSHIKRDSNILKQCY